VNIEEARLYLEHTSKDDFNLEEHQKENRYQAIQVVLKEIDRLNNIMKEIREYINSIGWNTTIPNIQDNVWRILDKENNNENN
jgi:hypothetical protein